MSMLLRASMMAALASAVLATITTLFSQPTLQAAAMSVAPADQPSTEVTNATCDVHSIDFSKSSQRLLFNAAKPLPQHYHWIQAFRSISLAQWPTPENSRINASRLGDLGGTASFLDDDRVMLISNSGRLKELIIGPELQTIQQLGFGRVRTWDWHGTLHVWASNGVTAERIDSVLRILRRTMRPHDRLELSSSTRSYLVINEQAAALIRQELSGALLVSWADGSRFSAPVPVGMYPRFGASQITAMIGHDGALMIAAPGRRIFVAAGGGGMATTVEGPPYSTPVRAQATDRSSDPVFSPFGVSAASDDGARPLLGVLNGWVEELKSLGFTLRAAGRHEAAGKVALAFTGYARVAPAAIADTDLLLLADFEAGRVSYALCIDHNLVTRHWITRPIGVGLGDDIQRTFRAHSNQEIKGLRVSLHRRGNVTAPIVWTYSLPDAADERKELYFFRGGSAASLTQVGLSEVEKAALLSGWTVHRVEYSGATDVHPELFVRLRHNRSQATDDDIAALMAGMEGLASNEANHALMIVGDSFGAVPAQRLWSRLGATDRRFLFLTAPFVWWNQAPGLDGTRQVQFDDNTFGAPADGAGSNINEFLRSGFGFSCGDRVQFVFGAVDPLSNVDDLPAECRSEANILVIANTGHDVISHATTKEAFLHQLQALESGLQ